MAGSTNRLPPLAIDNIPRRYCSGDVMLSDGKLRTVNYSIIEDGSFAGYNQGVEWCVTGSIATGPIIPPARPQSLIPEGFSMLDPTA